MAYHELDERKDNPSIAVAKSFLGKTATIKVNSNENNYEIIRGKILFFDFFNKQLLVQGDHEVVYIRHYLTISVDREEFEG